MILDAYEAMTRPAGERLLPRRLREEDPGDARHAMLLRAKDLTLEVAATSTTYFLTHTPWRTAR